MNWQPAFGKALERWRKLGNLSQQQLAERVGLHRTTIGSYEKGKQFPKTENLIAIVGGLRVDPSQFFAEVGEIWGADLKARIPGRCRRPMPAALFPTAGTVAGREGSDATVSPMEPEVPSTEEAETVTRYIQEVVQYIFARLPEKPLR